MRKASLSLVLLASVALGACGAPERAKPLPAPAHWVGDQVWVPQGDAVALSTAICNGAQTWGYHVQQWAYPYASHPFDGGELVVCEEGIREAFTSGR